MLTEGLSVAGPKSTQTGFEIGERLVKCTPVRCMGPAFRAQRGVFKVFPHTLLWFQTCKLLSVDKSLLRRQALLQQLTWRIPGSLRSRCATWARRRAMWRPFCEVSRWRCFRASWSSRTQPRRDVNGGRPFAGVDCMLLCAQRLTKLLVTRRSQRPAAQAAVLELWTRRTAQLSGRSKSTMARTRWPTRPTSSTSPGQYQFRASCGSGHSITFSLHCCMPHSNCPGCL